jgi:hypothetical protein
MTFARRASPVQLFSGKLFVTLLVMIAFIPDDGTRELFIQQQILFVPQAVNAATPAVLSLLQPIDVCAGRSL